MSADGAATWMALLVVSCWGVGKPIHTTGIEEEGIAVMVVE